VNTPPTPSAPLLSVIVPSLGGRDRLATLLEALAGQTLARERFEILVAVDGGRIDDETVARAHDVGARVVLLAERLGPGAARNRAAREARGTFLAFTEDDVTPAPDWLARAAERLDGSDPPDVLEGATQKPGGRPVRRHAEDCPEYLPTNLFVRRTLFLEVGGYDERYFDGETGAYFREDSDLGFTLEARGASIAREPRAVVVHPDEHPRFLDPVRWARRYEMDALLERRHPERFRERIEVHRWGPLRLRRPIVRSSLAYLAALLAAAGCAAFGARGLALFFVIVAAAMLVPLWAKWRFAPARLAVVPVVPFVLVAALAHGRRRAAASYRSSGTR
jgi:glycosyltransferase involved in cell wall biosynthesis